MNRLLLITPLLAFSTLYTWGQSRTEIINNKLKSQTVYEADYENSNGKETVEKIEKFDRRGNLIEIILYDKGKVIEHEKYEYDSQDNLTKEIRIDPAGKVNKTFVYKYTNGLKTERITYDAAGKKVKVKRYVYEYYE